MGDDILGLLRPQLAEQHEAACIKITMLPWESDPVAAAEKACEILRVAVDPGDDEGDVPWVLALMLVNHDDNIGLKLALDWLGYHGGARYEQAAFSLTVDAVAAYSVAAFHMLLGRR